MKKIFTLFVLITFLVSCGKTQEEEQQKVDEKKDFFVDLQEFSTFSNSTYLDKSGKINSSQNIELTAQANGRVGTISVKQWDPILKWQVLSVLEDSIANYGLSLQRAKTSLERAKINYDSQKINLDKSVFDAEKNVERLTNNLNALVKDTEENIKKAETDLENTNIEISDSKGALEVQKLENSIKKTQLDYENKLISDNETLEWFYSSVKKEYNSMVIFLWDIIEFSDTLYGVTELNKDENDDIDQFFWAKNTIQKNDTKRLLQEVITFNNDIFSEIDIESIDSQNEINDVLEKINIAYTKSKKLLNEVEKTLNFSIPSVNVLSEMDIANYNASVNGYQATLQGNYTGFLAFDNNVKSFLRTYKNAQDSLVQSIDLMKKDLEILKKSFAVNGELAEVGLNKTIINAQDSISNLEIQIESAKNTLENAKKTRDVTLRSLQNAIDDANIWYQTALKEYNKLTITAPINGTISDISIDVWQEINTGTPAFVLVNQSENEVDISFSKSELDYIDSDEPVFVEYDGKSYTGSIYSVSQTADKNLKYPATIKIDENINLIWNVVNVDIPVEIDHKLLPINIVKIVDDSKGQINILDEENKIHTQSIKIGNIYGEYIEVLEDLSPETRIVTNYVDNYREDKFNLKITTNE